MYLRLAPCCRHAKLFGASIIWSKHAVASLSTTIICIHMVLASSRDSTLVMARSMVQRPAWPPP